MNVFSLGNCSPLERSIFRFSFFDTWHLYHYVLQCYSSRIIVPSLGDCTPTDCNDYSVFYCHFTTFFELFYFYTWYSHNYVLQYYSSRIIVPSLGDWTPTDCNNYSAFFMQQKRIEKPQPLKCLTSTLCGIYFCTAACLSIIFHNKKPQTQQPYNNHYSFALGHWWRNTIFTVSHLVIGGETPSLQSRTWSSVAKHHLYSFTLDYQWWSQIFKGSLLVIGGETPSLKVRSWSSVAKHHL
jgi:hypothetical protein